MRAFDRYRNQQRWITLSDHFAQCFKMNAYYRAHGAKVNDKSVLLVAKM